MNAGQQLLKDISVVDFGLGIAGALAVRILADAGAIISRVEPASGDPFYALYPAYETWQRGKTVTRAGDIAAAVAGAAAALAAADVCVIGGEDFPGLAWKPDAQALARMYPRLVILDIGSGRHGTPEADAPAVDLLAQASSGMAYEYYSNRPLLLALPAPAYGAALQGLAGLMAALCERETSGDGQIVRTSLFEGALSWLGHCWCKSERTDPALDFVVPKDVVPLIFRCADGEYIHFTLGTTNARANVYGLFGIDDPTLAADPRGLPSLARGTRNYYGDIDLLQSHVGKWRRADLLRALWGFGLPAEAVQNPGEAWDDPQVAHNGTIWREADGARRVGLPFRVAPGEPGVAAARPDNQAPGATDTPLRGTTDSPLRGTTDSPLRGVRIVDFGNFTAGPHASMMLGDLGADVIKVGPLTGDPMRGFYRPYSTSSRGKRALAVDMKKPEGLEIVLRLCRAADMVHHNFRPGVTKRLGIDVETLRGLKPGLIMLENSGYGSSGPKSGSGGLDMIFQAFCGHERHGAGLGNAPICYRISTVDFAAGVLGAIASLIAQLRKIQTGAGAAIATSLLDSGLFLLSELVQAADGRFLELPALNHAQTGFHPAEQLYQARDGWVGIAARGEAMARDLLGVLALERDIFAPRQAWGEAEAERIAAAIAGWDCAKLLAALRAAGVWAVLCRTDAENAVLSDPGLQELGTTVASHYPRYGEVRQIGRLFSLSRSNIVVRGETAALGQHSREILAELGYSDSDIARLYESNVVA